MKSKFAFLALVLAASPAAAQIQFSGSSTGCFGLNCTPRLASGADYLNYTGQNFNGWTNSSGALAMNFGYFTWDAFTGVDWNDSPFTLFLNFTNPTGITPAPIYGGNAQGLIIKGKLFRKTVNISTTFVMFEPNVRDYIFAGGNPNSPGSFTLTINDTYVNGTGKSYLRGDISNAMLGPTTATPEPITLTLLGTGLAGMAAIRRRRKKPADELDA